MASSSKDDVKSMEANLQKKIKELQDQLAQGSLARKENAALHDALHDAVHAAGGGRR